MDKIARWEGEEREFSEECFETSVLDGPQVQSEDSEDSAASE